MASLKKLAGQTMWYGLSSIFASFLNYLLTPYLTHYMSASVYGEMSLIYSAIPFMNVVYTYGMETTFFRFSNKDHNGKHVYNIGSISLIATTLVFTFIIITSRIPLANLLRVDEHPQFVTWAASIIAIDTLSTLPFAKLRNDGRPRKYAFIKVAGIILNILLVVFFYTILPSYAKNHSDTFIASWYSPSMGAGYYIIANLAMSIFTFLLLLPEFLSIRFDWDTKLWKEMLIYSAPLLIVGFGGVINETFDRIMLGWWSPAGDELAKKAEVGIYSACYKLSILITLFVRAFRMGAEPFFFQQARGEDAPKTYARVMNYFIMILCVMFLVVMLYLDIWKQFIRNPQMWTGLSVVPLLLIANMCLGAYYNLAIWYKLSHKTNAGATITIIGAIITLLINYVFIPHYSYIACAWATLACYGSMMLISYFWGQKVFPIPYNVSKLLRLFGVMLLVYALHYMVCQYVNVMGLRLLSGTSFMFIYLAFIFISQKEDLKTLPVIGKYIR
ncbi:MAG: polysaccharide biosynthesis protein [Bacteroidetes bacterium]|nr:polysaccharide biosynthesis protein [Bacteroidota bacterium]